MLRATCEGPNPDQNITWATLRFCSLDCVNEKMNPSKVVAGELRSKYEEAQRVGPYRVGRKLGRTLYRDNVCIGMVDDAEIARFLVGVANYYIQQVAPIDVPSGYNEVTIPKLQAALSEAISRTAKENNYEDLHHKFGYLLANPSRPPPSK